MDWLLNHPQVLVVVAIAVAALFQKLKQARSQEAAGGSPAQDPEDAERTRRIQEEIRRRIRERRGLAPAVPPAPLSAGDEPEFPAAPPMIEEVRPVVVEPPPLPLADADSTAEYERQQAMLQQLRALKARHQTSAGTAPAAPVPAPPVGAVVAAPFSRLTMDLHNPAGLRRAIVLREILGPPLGMR
jgi:hypothetical protein